MNSCGYSCTKITARGSWGVQAVLDNLKSLGMRRLAILGGIGAALVTVLFFGLSLAVAPDYAPLYRDMSPAEASRVVGALEGDDVNEGAIVRLAMGLGETSKEAVA